MRETRKGKFLGIPWEIEYHEHSDNSDGEIIHESSDMSFEELSDIESGTVLLLNRKRIFHNIFIFGMIMRGPSSLTAYIGIPKWHPLCGVDYDEIPLWPHGGLTYGGNDDLRPDDLYWFGWDYSHLGDYAFYDLDQEYRIRHEGKDKKWTVKEVKEELEEELNNFIPIFLWKWIKIKIKLWLRSKVS